MKQEEDMSDFLESYNNPLIQILAEFDMFLFVISVNTDLHSLFCFFALYIKCWIQCLCTSFYARNQHCILFLGKSLYKYIKIFFFCCKEQLYTISCCFRKMCGTTGIINTFSVDLQPFSKRKKTFFLLSRYAVWLEQASGIEPKKAW